MLAPRFLASAFVSGPAFILLVLRVLRSTSSWEWSPRPAQTLIQIIRVAMAANLLMLFSELFTLFYTGSGHAAARAFVVLRQSRRDRPGPWIWTAVTLNLVGTALFCMPHALERGSVRIAACIMCIIGIWIEKGMGLVVPGFIPSTLHEIVKTLSSPTEWKGYRWHLGLQHAGADGAHQTDCRSSFATATILSPTLGRGTHRMTPLMAKSRKRAISATSLLAEHYAAEGGKRLNSREIAERRKNSPGHRGERC